MPLIALLAAPLLACFVGGVMAAAARPGAVPAEPPAAPDNVIRLADIRRRA